MITLALTGSIGMGKSTVAAMFGQRGIPVLDADAVVRQVQGPGGAVVEAIEARFPGTTRAAGVDRELLSSAVLAKPAELLALEGIVHPAVHHVRTRFIVANASASALLFDIPLLFETGGDDVFDHVIVVSAPADVQRRRVLARPGMTEARLDAILARQMPDDQKRSRAEFVIDTAISIGETERQVDAILAGLEIPERA
jgi:dephospho-CoA kinase